MTTTPEFLELIRSAIEDELWPRMYALPARIESYDAKTTSARVVPTVKIPRNDEAAEGGFSFVDPPPISGVRVVSLLGGGAYITSKPVKGDFCLIVVCTVSIDDWIKQGGIGVTPEDTRRQDISDAVAIMGFNPGGDPLPGNDAHTDLCIEAPIEIKLGAGASSFVALASLVNARFAELKSWITDPSPTGLGAQVAAFIAIAAPIVGPAPWIPSIPPVDASKVKAE